MKAIVLAPGWPRILALSAPPLVGIALLAAAFLASPAPPPYDPAAAAVKAVAVPPPAGLLVFVSGAVVHPGLYRMARGDRVYAAVQAAGGLVAQADATKLPDMAQRLRDGQQIKVPYRKGLGPVGGGTTSGRVSLNAATYDELMTVPGFSADLAQAVIDYRSHYGGFTTVKELVTLLGMDYAAFITAKPLIRV